MRRPFALLVQRTLPAESPAAGLILVGPMLGPFPQAADPLTARNGEHVARLRYEGSVRLRKDDASAESGILVSGPGVALAGERALVHEEGILVRAYKAQLRERMAQVQAPARFQLDEGDAYGFLRVAGRVVDAWVVGGGLPENADLWQQLVEARTPDDFALRREELMDRALLATRAGSHPRSTGARPPFPELTRIEGRVVQ